MHTSSSIAERRDPSPPAAAFATAGSPGLWATHAITASDLQGKAFEPLRYVLPGFIPEGATLLVSRPKLGKSWLMLDLCIAIADDGITLGRLKPAAGDVLYLALEDGERRLQRRMTTLLPNAVAWPSRLTLATRWRRANEGGIADIRDWCRWVEKPTAVVVDTLEKFRSLHSGRSSGRQPHYDAVVQLQKIAIEQGMAVIIVHHQRKTNADDPFDTIAGTTGLAGAADTILMMKRTERDAVLHVRGRDVEDSETLMTFNKESCKWSVCGPTSAPLSNQRAAIMAILAQAASPMKVADIVGATGSTRSAIDTLLHRLVAERDIVRIAPGRYAARPERQKENRRHDTDPNGKSREPQHLSLSAPT